MGLRVGRHGQTRTGTDKHGPTSVAAKKVAPSAPVPIKVPPHLRPSRQASQHTTAARLHAKPVSYETKLKFLARVLMAEAGGTMPKSKNSDGESWSAGRSQELLVVASSIHNRRNRPELSHGKKTEDPYELVRVAGAFSCVSNPGDCPLMTLEEKRMQPLDKAVWKECQIVAGELLKNTFQPPPELQQVVVYHDKTVGAPKAGKYSAWLYKPVRLEADSHFKAYSLDKNPNPLKAPIIPKKPSKFAKS